MTDEEKKQLQHSFGMKFDEAEKLFNDIYPYFDLLREHPEDKEMIKKAKGLNKRLTEITRELKQILNTLKKS